LRRLFKVGYEIANNSTMNRFIQDLAISVALLSFAFGQSATQADSENSKSEQEVRQAIEKYRTALLQRDTPALEKIWADDYIFVNASGEVLTKAQRLANAKSGATTLDSINEEENITVRVYQNSAVATSRCDHQAKVWWSTDRRPIPEHARLGKRLDRVAISL